MALEMNIVWALILLHAGFLILFKSANWLVTGAVSLAKWLGVSPLVIGLTVVAMGTSAPEVAASIAAAVKGWGDVAIGNVYGSNIANLALVGGLCALIRPIRVQSRILRREIPVMLVSALLLWPVLAGKYLSRPEGFVLLGVFAVLILITVYAARKETTAQPEPSSIKQTTSNERRASSNGSLFVVIGLAGLVLGAKMVVEGAVFLGTRIGLSQAVIGLTIIAIGTSLPELVTCLVASLKGQDDISIGNLVGSNVFNTLLVVGSAGAIRPFNIAARLIGIDYWIMIAVSAAFILMAIIGRRISRANGAILLLAYLAYILYLFVYSG